MSVLNVSVCSILPAQVEKSPETSAIAKTVDVSWLKRYRQGFTMKLWLSDQLTMGQAAWNSLNLNDCDIIGLEYPVGHSSCTEHLLGAGPLIGGLVYDPATAAYLPRVSEGFNSTGSDFYPEITDTARNRIWRSVQGDPLVDYNFDPPRALSRTVNRKGCDDDADGKIDEDELDGMDNDGDWSAFADDVGADGLPDSLEVSCDGRPYDPVTNPDPAQDNFAPGELDPCHVDPSTGGNRAKSDRDLYTEGNGLPDHGEPHVDEDYGTLSDNDIYIAATDTAWRSGIPTSRIPLGIKIFQKSYAWRGDFADGILPMDYYFVNVGKNTIKDVYIGFFADLHVGPKNIADFFAHNYSCYIPELRTAYSHNARDRGSTPLGLTILGASVPLDQLKYIFQWTSGGTAALPTDDREAYSWVSGESFGGQLIKTCQPPETPGHMTLFYSFGPFNGRDGNGFRKGDTVRVSVAWVSGEGVDKGPHSLRFNAARAIQLYSHGYTEPVQLPSPKFTVEEGFKKVTLRWYPSQTQLGGAGPGETWDDSNAVAESFPDTSWRRRNPPCESASSGPCSGGTPCTIVDGKPYRPGGRILEGFRLYRSEDPSAEIPNPKSFSLMKEYDLTNDAYGFNTGIDSVLVDSNLTRGKRYWYAVTSFGLPNRTILRTTSASSPEVVDTLYVEGSESSISENATRVDLSFSVSTAPDQVLVVPNPYRVDQNYTFESGGWEGREANWTENNRLVKFIHLPGKCTIRIMTLAGEIVTTLYHDDPVRGEIEWDILSEAYRALASGVYIYVVESDLGKQVGKFVLIR